MQPDRVIAIRYNKAEITGLACLALLLIVLFAYIAVYPRSTHRYSLDGMRAIAVLGVIGVGRVDWTDVRGLRIITRWRSKELVVEVHDPLHFVDRGNVLQRLIRAPGYWLLHLSPVRLRSVMLDTHFDGLVWAITVFLDEAKASACATLSSGVRDV